MELRKEAAKIREIFTREVGKEAEQVSDAMIVAMFTKLRQQIRNIAMRDWDLTKIRLDVSSTPSQSFQKTDRTVGLKKWRLQGLLFKHIYENFFSKPILGLEGLKGDNSIEDGLANFESALNSHDIGMHIKGYFEDVLLIQSGRQ